MGYLSLIILLSRYIFAGFALLFVIVMFSNMKPFIGYSLADTGSKNVLMFLCIVFIHIGSMGLLIASTDNIILQGEQLFNSIMVLGAMSLTLFILRFTKAKEQLSLWLITFFLFDIGYIMLERLDHQLATLQMYWLIVGLIGALIIPMLFRKLLNPKYQWVYFGGAAFLIILPFVFGEAKFGATNWIQIGHFSLQPSEVVKILLVCFLASILPTWIKQNKGYTQLIVASICTGFLIICLVLQKDLGAALLYYLIFILLLYTVTEKIRWPLLGMGLGILASILGYVLFGHVRVRVEAWLNPWQDIAGSGYQVVQGLFAMGTWGFFGSGLTRGTPNKIPIATTDYLFAAISEEFGTFIGIMIILCYLGLILQGFRIVLKQKNAFNLYLTIGLVLLLGIQSLIILGGVLKLIPLTGITLPFISYGGTSLTVSFMIIGLLTQLSKSTLKTSKKPRVKEV